MNHDEIKISANFSRYGKVTFQFDNGFSVAQRRKLAPYLKISVYDLNIVGPSDLTMSIVPGQYRIEVEVIE